MCQRIYFLLNLTNRQIKIGIAENIERRERQLVNEHDAVFSLLACYQGTVNDERAAHSACRNHRISGEWFADCAFVRDYAQNQIKQRMSATLKKLDGYIEMLEKHGETENREWHDDIAGAIDEETAEYRDLLKFLNRDGL